jgi:hypothetical protein
MTQIVFTTRDGKAWSMDWWFSKKAQLQTMISMEINEVEYSPKCVVVVYMLAIICSLESQRSRRSRDIYSTYLTIGNLKISD